MSIAMIRRPAVAPAHRSCVLIGCPRDCFSWSTPSLLPYREVWSIAQPSARVRLLALPLVQPHPPPRLHQRCLCRCVRGLQRAPEGGVLGAGEPVGSVTLQCRELPTRPERSRAVSLVTSFGSCGPIYGSLIVYQKTVE